MTRVSRCRPQNGDSGVVSFGDLGDFLVISVTCNFGDSQGPFEFGDFGVLFLASLARP